MGKVVTVHAKHDTGGVQVHQH